MCPDQIDAISPVQTRHPDAIVDVPVAAGTREPVGARATEPVDLIYARPPVRAGIRVAVVHLRLAIRPRETGSAVAFEPEGPVRAGPPVVTVRVLTRDRDLFAVVPLVPPRALAGVAFSQVLAGPTVLAGVLMSGATVQHLLAIRPGESGLTAAGVGSLTGVEANPPVFAGLVVRAIVEILVAEQTPPTFVADAVPLLLARTVKASGIPFTFVAEFTLPAAVTSGNNKKRKGTLF